ncbi:NERD domain-containing protein [Arthrobacter sp. I2-34]|uniref:NERD domain-containing protein n=1 Tax=Arthrobacter hankyongi TaxID=2904801 RepID=A0ABS9L8N1_9MICC|nr:nuclease-related domain-containing protein [Arthrobacter hankyongi]MCG2623029.1 NERD domain-containing protein [Arthrobacter hankyongi]
MTFNPAPGDDPAFAGRDGGPQADASGGSTPLQERIPGQSVISELLAVHERDRPQSRLGRVFGADPLGPDSRPWYLGALGEIRVGKILARLGPDWTVLHAVPVGAGTSDIDHVVIGPAGVFTLNTKNHANQSVWVAGNTLMVAGHRQRHIPNAAHEASRAARLLTAAAGEPVAVTGVLVIVGAKTLTVREQPAGVAVVTDRQLLRWLTRRKPVLDPVQVARIGAAACLPGTWHRNPPVPAETAALHRGFAGLQQLVDSARRRRIAWALGALAALLATLIPAAATVLLTVFAP